MRACVFGSQCSFFDIIRFELSPIMFRACCVVLCGHGYIAFVLTVCVSFIYAESKNQMPSIPSHVSHFLNYTTLSPSERETVCRLMSQYEAARAADNDVNVPIVPMKVSEIQVSSGPGNAARLLSNDKTLTWSSMQSETSQKASCYSRISFRIPSGWNWDKFQVGSSARCR